MALGTPSAQMLTKLPSSVKGAGAGSITSARNNPMLQRPVLNGPTAGQPPQTTTTTTARATGTAGAVGGNMGAPVGRGQHTTGWTYGTPDQGTLMTRDNWTGYNGGAPITDVEDARAWLYNTGTYASSGGLREFQAEQRRAQEAAWQQNQRVLDYLRAQSEAARLQYSTAADDYRLQMEQARPRNEFDIRSLNENADISRRLLELERQRNVDLAYNYNQQQRGFTDRGYRTAIDYLGQQRGFAGRDRDSSNTYLGLQRELAQRNYGSSLARSGFNRDTQREAAMSAATAGGAVLSGAVNRPWSNTGEEYRLSANEAGNTLFGANASIDRGLRDTALAYDRAISDITRGERDATLTRDRARADEDRTDAYIASLAQTYGVRAEEIETGLRQAAARANMEYSDLVARLDGLAASNDQQAAAAAAAVLAGGAMYQPAGDGTTGPTNTGNVGGNVGRTEYNIGGGRRVA